MKKPVLLMIRDGWGISPNQTEGISTAQKEGNAPLLARTPFHDELFANYPLATLSGSGEDVGLPSGQMGNSEVGHLNLGAGRIVYQDITRINKAIHDGTFFTNKILVELMQKTKETNKALHLIGLVSDGGVHSHLEHLFALLKMSKELGLAPDKVYIHAITDGRDTSPTNGKKYLEALFSKTEEIGCGKIATIVGRYYAMDRDTRWERTQLAYDLFTLGEGSTVTDPKDVIELSYSEGITDEFLKPICLLEGGGPLVNDGDGVFFFNFRSDRARQFSQALKNNAFDGFQCRHKPKVNYATMTRYDETYSDWGIQVAFGPQSMDKILGEVVSEAGLSQCRIAETEKYPHVTFFFNGGTETPYPKEDRKLIASPKVATYDLQPEMSSEEVIEIVLETISSGKYDLIILNFANPDMVGHTGNLEAAIKAVEAIDHGTEKILNKLLKVGGRALITADHGNCEQMIAKDGTPHTAHTTNLVHFVYVGEDHKKIKLESGILADVAPTLLKMLGVAKPSEMTGRSLISQK
ncbi:MAG: 2,3-bisphosphoglycerate-independent phosphoglycerate mutase [Verrucomicrobiota bacterium]